MPFFNCFNFLISSIFETPPEAKIGISHKFEISFNCLKFGPFNVPSLLISVQIKCEKFIPDIFFKYS